jgi:NADH-quinone oxidoreductase subunit C
LLTAVDQPERFEVVYHLWSIKDRTTEPFVLKVYIGDKENPAVPSVTPIWRGANYQEREAYDLMGIRFEGHPNLKRIVLWEGFPGHPLRKDFENRTYTFEELKPTRPTGPEW